MKSVSIIIPAWNEVRTLGETIKALLNIDYDKKRCEVIVVAGGDDNTYDIAEEMSARMRVFTRYVLIVQQPGGKNSAIQQGIKKAKNDIIVLLDADTIVNQNWLKYMVSPIGQGHCDLTIANAEPVRKNWISEYYMIIKRYFADRIMFYPGHSIAFEANAIENQLEYFFDEGIEVGVDYLLEKRFLEQGKRIMVLEDVVARTHLPSSLKYFVLAELRWLTALIKIDGIHYRTLACHIAVNSALVLVIPLQKFLFLLSLMFHSIYICKRVRMFIVGSGSKEVRNRNIFGFIILSYLLHVVGLVAYLKYFLGLSKDCHLYQGQRS